MPIVLHFFRESNLEKIDIEKIIDFFSNNPNYRFYEEEDIFSIKYADEEFKFSYRFMITKKSRVTQIYRLSPKYGNLNFCLEMPVLIPRFLAQEVLGVAQKLCNNFQLAVYHETFDDISPFNITHLLVLFERVRSASIKQFGYQGKYTYDFDKLSVVCKYQRSVANLQEFYKDQVEVNLVNPIVELNSTFANMSCLWNVGEAILFPPYIDYIYIMEAGSIPYIIKSEDFFRNFSKYIDKVEAHLPDLYIMKKKAAKKASKNLKKIKKFMFNIDQFKKIRLCDVVDKIQE